MTGQEQSQKLIEEFATLWAGMEQGRDQARTSLNLADIINAAVAIADESGLSEVSMARIAKRLGYTTMALYRHVPNKGVLLVLMFDAGVGEPPLSILEMSGWRNRMHAYADAYATLFRRRPWLFDIPISGPPIGPNNIGMLNLGLTALEETGLEVRDRLDAFMVLTNYLSGTQRLENEMSRTGDAARKADTAVDEASYGRVLTELLPAGKFAAVDAAISAGVFDGGDDTRDEELRRGVDFILDGIEALMIRRGVSSPA